MKKNILVLCAILLFILNFKSIEAIGDFSGGTSSGGSIGSGSWSSGKVALKVSLVSSSNSLKETKIFVNKNGISGKVSHQALKPKTKQSKSISWVSNSKLGDNLIKNKKLPSSWMDSDDNNINIYDTLSASKYKLLLNLLNSFTTKGPGDYILVEPMTYIGGYYGTAFELGNDFMNSTYDNEFSKIYKKRLFSGSDKMSKGGLFYTTIYLTSDVSAVGLNEFKYSKKDLSNSEKYKERNNCLLSSSCGRGIGVFKYDDIYSGKLKIIKQDSDTKKKLSGAGFTLYSDSSCSKKIKNEVKTDSKGVATFNNLATGKYYYKETTVPSGYTGDSNCRAASVKNGKTKKVTIKNKKIAEEGDLVIYIKNSLTKKTIISAGSQATYEIYKGANCTGTKIATKTTSSGMATLEDLVAGTYSIKEVIPPDTEKYAEKVDKCVKINVPIVAKTKRTEEIFYDPVCQTKLAESDKSVRTLLELYREYPENNGLLNFSAPTCLPVDCDTKKPSVGCLSGYMNYSTFNSDNMSCPNPLKKESNVTEIKDLTGKLVGFCVDNFILTNNLNQNNFYSISGQFLIRKTESNKIQFHKNKNELIEIDNQYVATATVGKVCYVLQGTVPSGEAIQKPDFKVFFGKNNHPDDPSKPDVLPYVKNSTSASSFESNGFIKYEYIDHYNFNLNTVYLKKITGEFELEKSPITIEEVGVLIQFKDIDGGTIPFKIEYDKEKYSSDQCKYTSDPEIIQYPPDNPKGELDLEFRIINLEKPFLDESGATRPTNSNWCDYSAEKANQCNPNNDLVTKYIINSPSSYGISKTGAKLNPIYTIELTSSDIKGIREYNKENPYDNYEVYCDGGVCTNSFLFGLQSGKLNKYKNNKIDKSYGNVNKLVINK